MVQRTLAYATGGNHNVKMALSKEVFHEDSVSNVARIDGNTRHQRLFTTTNYYQELFSSSCTRLN